MQFHSFVVVAATLLRTASAQDQYTATSPSSVDAARATALTLSPTSHVRGKTFDRFVNIWLENTDYDMAFGDPSLKSLAKQGITLTNYHGITHPSQPNYVSGVGGSQNGVYTNSATSIDKSVKTIVDLLDAKNVSWSEYQEGMPYSGFEGDWVNQQNGANMYMRKHNPLMSYDSVTSQQERLAKIKNFTLFYSDLENETLPQWMFITPNMTNDGHDSSVTVAGTWAKGFLEPLLRDPKFLSNTLVVLTFDETESYTSSNRVFTILLGDAVPVELHGTVRNATYNHYSSMATVERNWDLGNLGLGDKTSSPYF